MKKLISTVLALGMAASLAACGSSAAATPASTADAVSAESAADTDLAYICLLYTSPSPRDMRRSRMPSSA